MNEAEARTSIEVMEKGDEGSLKRGLVRHYLTPGRLIAGRTNGHTMLVCLGDFRPGHPVILGSRHQP